MTPCRPPSRAWRAMKTSSSPRAADASSASSSTTSTRAVQLKTTPHHHSHSFALSHTSHAALKHSATSTYYNFSFLRRSSLYHTGRFPSCKGRESASTTVMRALSFNQYLSTFVGWSQLSFLRRLTKPRAVSQSLVDAFSSSRNPACALFASTSHARAPSSPTRSARATREHALLSRCHRAPSSASSPRRRAKTDTLPREDAIDHLHLHLHLRTTRDATRVRSNASSARTSFHTSP